MNQEKRQEKKEFSKFLLIQESILIWIITIGFMILAALAVFNNYTGSLSWIVSLPSVAWAAYGVSQTMYYKKSMKENTKGGIKYDSIITPKVYKEEI